MSMRDRLVSVEEFHCWGGVTSGSLPVFAQVPELVQQNLTSAIQLRPGPDTKPLLERGESCLPDICSAHFAVRFEVPLEFHVCLPRRPEKMCSVPDSRRQESE